MAKRTRMCIAHPDQTVPCATCASIAAISYDQTKPINDKTARYTKGTCYQRQR